MGGLFVVVDLTAANRDDTPTSGVFLVAEFEAPFACLHFLSSISVCVNGPPLGIRNGVHCLYKTNAAALASVVRCILLFLPFAVGHYTRPSILQNWRQSKSPRRIWSPNRLKFSLIICPSALITTCLQRSKRIKNGMLGIRPTGRGNHIR